MADYREELLTKTLVMLNERGVENLDVIRDVLVMAIGDYEIVERCTELTTLDNNNERYIKLFLATKRTEGGSDATAKTRSYILRKFCYDINKSFLEVDVFDIRIWLANMQQQVSLSTAESYRSILASLFNWMTHEEFIPKNPMANIKPIKHPEAIKKSFTSVEVNDLKDACKTLTERTIVELLLSSGLRCEELCNLKWADIDFVTKDVRVIEGKGNKNRVTMMDDVTRKYLLEYKNNMKFASEYIFAVKYRGEIKIRTTDSVQRMIKIVAERANIAEAHPHKFRHTFATTLYKRGMDVHMIQRLLGHSNINTTMIYIDSDADSLRDAYKKCV